MGDLCSRNIRSLEELPRLLALVAARSSGLLNHAQLGRDLEMPRATVQRYLDLLKALYLIQLIPPWHLNLGQRIVKSPKVQVTDSGLAANLLGFDERRFETDTTSVPGPGALFESFVAMELMKQVSWADAPARICHYRDARGVEVDLVLERDDGSVVGVEVKLTESPSGDDFKGLRHLRDELGDRFRAGALIYAGAESVPFGERLHAVPVAALWHG